jgi:hypothetical protein
LRKALIPAVLLIVALYLTSRAACSNQELIRFFGKWSGGFRVETIRNGPDTPEERKRYGLEGFVMVYATKHSFKMHLEGEQEVLDLAGFWTVKGQRLTLKVTEVKIDDQGGADLRDPNRKFIPPADIQAAYARPIVLDLSPDKKRYTGLPISIGPLIGRHLFVKD